MVIVLGCIVILTGLIVALLILVTYDLHSAKDYSSVSEVKLLADSTANLVMGQIQDATTTAANNNEAWISQPGLIRLFGSGKTQVATYKLYSAGAPGSATFNPGYGSSPSDVPADGSWKTLPADYVDLNTPVVVKGTAIYPILDAGGWAQPSGAPPVPGATVTGIQGFDYDRTSGSASSWQGAQGSGDVAMPVRWLYVLKDGSMAPASNGTVPGASATNPIQSRIAYWTDDETCKVNINTAAGDLWNPPLQQTGTFPSSTYNQSDTALNAPVPGAFFDVPRAVVHSEEDLMLGNQQVRNEYQRYPGHPMTTYLSAVFPFLTRSQIPALSPRLPALSYANTLGGSQGGTVPTIVLTGANHDSTWEFNTTFTQVNPSQTVILPATTPGQPGYYRLYDSVDELLYAQSGSGTGTGFSRNVISSTSSVPSPLSPVNLTQAQINQARFFITAHSRAPEINLYNQPRVTIWPISSSNDANHRSALDQEIVRCSTVGGQALYFQRTDPTSPTTDATAGNNSNVLAYLNGLAGQAVPGFGGSFTSKYPNMSQIMTEIFDYIRCTNLIDPTIANPYTPSIIPTSSSTLAPATVVPIKIGSTRGFGRFPTLSELGFDFFAEAGNSSPPTPPNPKTAATTTTSIRVALLLDLFCPAMGDVRYFPSLTETLQGNIGMNITFYDSSGTNALGTVATQIPSGSNPIRSDAWLHYEAHGGPSGVDEAFYNPSTPGAYPFVTPPITVPPNTVSMSVSFQPGTTATVALSTVNASFTQNVTVPLTPSQFLTNAQIPLFVQNLATREANASANSYPNSAFIQMGGNLGGDIVVAWQQSDYGVFGDLRLSALKDILATDNVFRIHPAYTSINVGNYYNSSYGFYQNASNIRFEGNYPFSSPRDGDPAAELNPNAKLNSPSNLKPYSYFTIDSAAPSSYGSGGAYFTYNGKNVSGDWDTGEYTVVDGPYINKASEGVASYPETGAAPNNISSSFSPNRQIASAVNFGSLSTGFNGALTKGSTTPWQTLLFCPNPASIAGTSPPVTPATGDNYATVANHPGAVNPPDHLLLDLFTMPVVEPYAISEPFSTAGKINMNYQIVPFTYIKRATGLEAVLRSTKVTAIDGGCGDTHYVDGAPAGADCNFRYDIDIDHTLEQFEWRFENNLPFVSASEICEQFLVPNVSNVLPTPNLNLPATLLFNPVNTIPQTMVAWWTRSTTGTEDWSISKWAGPYGYTSTGDNLREKPYGDIYPRLTTKSNTFTVHVWAQTLQKVPSTSTGANAGRWVQGTDVVTSEYRGSYVVERYLDPNITSYSLTNPSSTPLNYKFHVVSSRQFNP